MKKEKKSKRNKEKKGNPIHNMINQKQSKKLYQREVYQNHGYHSKKKKKELWILIKNFYEYFGEPSSYFDQSRTKEPTFST